MPRRAAYGLHSPEVAAWYREMAFASACSMRIASGGGGLDGFTRVLCLSVLHADCIRAAQTRSRAVELCLSVLHADCIRTK